MKEELEREGGGLCYSFDMRRGKHWREVGVDAITGKVLENTAEPQARRLIMSCAESGCATIRFGRRNPKIITDFYNSRNPTACPTMISGRNNDSVRQHSA
jgi:hypothetical protein